jgi:hypothetical protein
MAPHEVEQDSPAALPIQTKVVPRPDVEYVATSGHSVIPPQTTNGDIKSKENGDSAYNVNGIPLKSFRIGDHPIDENTSLKVDKPTSSIG